MHDLYTITISKMHILLIVMNIKYYYYLKWNREYL